MADSYSDERLILTARLYYIDGLSQPQIAQLADVSQSKISRMLALARDRGLVRISVPEYEPRHKELENHLIERLGLRRAIVIRTTAHQPIAAVRETVGYFAAPLVSALVEPDRTLAIAGGRTMQALVGRMRPAGAALPTGGPVTTIQAMGNIDSSPGQYDAIELGRALAQRWGGAFLTLNAPAILPDADTCRRFLKLAQIGEVMQRLEAADLALVGVGTPANSVFVERGVLTPADDAALRQAGAIGEVLGRFFDAAGRPCATALGERVVSLNLEALRRIPEVIAVVSGNDRSLALRAAIAGGLIKSLVIDEGGAAALLEVS